MDRTIAGSLAVAFALGGALAQAGCSQEGGVDRAAGVAVLPVAADGEASDEVNPRLLRRFQPLKATMDSDSNPPSSAKTALGRQLFYDPRLSKSGTLSCNGCHDLRAYGADHVSFSRGHDGRLGTRNAPTVYNAAGAFSQFWDGRASDVEEQAQGPLLNPLEMGMPSGAAIVAALEAVPAYRRAFAGAFPDEADPITLANVGRAIGAFERGLTTPGRWDRYLAGDKAALTPPEKEGLKTFLNVGCMVCHTGPYLGGSMFERVGVVEPWPNQSDKGRADITKAASDAMVFKVPTLRNVAETAPYFHDGSAATLDEAVRMMGKYQLGIELSGSERTSIVTWLKSLTGDRPLDFAAPKEKP